MLTVSEIQLILELLKAKYGAGYSEDKKVGALQAKLVVMQQAAETRERRVVVESHHGIDMLSGD